MAANEQGLPSVWALAVQKLNNYSPAAVLFVSPIVARQPKLRQTTCYMPPFCQAMAKKPYTLFQKFRRVINANLKHEREVYTSGRVTNETKLKIREERINVMEWVKDWLDRINNEEK